MRPFHWRSLLASRGFLAAILFTVALARPASAALSRPERRLVAAVDAHQAASLALLEKLVNVNSGTYHQEGVREVGRMLTPELEALGFQTRWVDGAAWGRAGHLIGERRGPKGATRVLLIGHLDTVFEPTSFFQRYRRRNDSTATGPGVCDMKGGDVVMLLALRALADTHALERLDVTVVLTGDEEAAGRPLSLARADLLEAARRADVAIGFEDGAGDPRTPVIGRRGASDWHLEVQATTAHSSQIGRDDVGSGAIHEAARILVAFRDSLTGEPLLTLNPGLILGGTSLAYESDASRGTAEGKSNIIADTAFVKGDLRTISVEQRERAKATMQRIVQRSGAHARAWLVFDDGYPPLSPSAGNQALLARYDAASRDLGAGPLTAADPRNAGAADVSWTGGITPMAIDGVGLMGRGGHTPSETADLNTLALDAKRTALVLMRFATRH
jgi:glutamate carboxypeptidase